MPITFAWFRDALLALRVVRAPLIIALFASLTLAVPPQTLEIYLILVQDMLYAGRWRELALSLLALILMSIVIWFAAARLVAVLRHAFTPDLQDGPYHTILDWAPKVIATLPIFAVALGLSRAPRISVSPDVLQTFFAPIAEAMFETASSASFQELENPIAGILHSIGSMLSAFIQGKVEIASITNHDMFAILASDALLHLGTHLFWLLGLGLLVAFEGQRSGAPTDALRRRPAVRALLWICIALVAVLFLIVPLLETPAKYLEYTRGWLATKGVIGDAPLAKLAWSQLQAAWYVRASLAGVAVLLESWAVVDVALHVIVVVGLLYLLWRAARRREEGVRAAGGGEDCYLGRYGRIGLYALVIGCTAAVIAWPVQLPTWLGTLPVLALFVSLIAFSVCQLTFWSERAWRFPLVVLCALLAVLFSLFDLNDNHRIRTLASAAPAKAPEAAGTDGEFARWYEARADKARFATKKYPVYIVAAEGGGIYAAYHAAAFLAHLQAICPRFSQHLFAISGVSGGSVGAAVFAAFADATARNAPDGECQLQSSVGTGGTRMTQNALGHDLLTPVTAAMLFPDFLQRFLPLPVPRLDRARALEAVLERAWRDAAVPGKEPAEPGERCDHLLCRDFLAHWNPAGATPALLINTTEVGSGRRRVIAPFRFPGGADLRFLPLWDDAYEAWSVRDRGEAILIEGARPPALTLPLSTAAVLSARFPWVTPAGWFYDYLPEAALPTPGPAGEKPKERFTAKRQKVRLVDGGYFENSGVATAQDLINSIESSPVADKVEVKLIVLTTGTFSEQTSFALGEAIDPVLALLNVREARTHITIASARSSLDAKDRLGAQALPHRLRTVTLRGIGYSLPLGWRLSELTQKLIELQNGNPDRCATLGTEYQDKPAQGSWAPSTYEADCLVGLIADELSGGSAVWSGSKGEIARAKGDLELAASQCYKDDPGQVSIDGCTRVIERLPRAVAAYNYRGSARVHGGDTTSAIADFTMAIKLYPIDGEAYRRRGAVYESMGRTDLALADYTAAIEHDAYSAFSYIKRASLYAKQGQHLLAISDYTTVIGTWPRRAGTYLLRAEAYRRTGDLARAVADYSRLIELAPDNASYPLYRGLTRFTQADFKGAAPDFQRSIELGGGAHAILYRYLAQARADEGAAAVRELEASAARLDSREWPYATLELFLDRAKPEAVIAAAAKTAERCEAQFYIGQWHLLRGSLPEAAAAWRAAAETCAKNEFEHDGAVAELKRLGN